MSAALRRPRTIAAENKKRIRKLAETIRKSETFNMLYFYHPCGTPACIGGHAGIGASSSFPDRTFASRFGINQTVASWIIYPNSWEKRLDGWHEKQQVISGLESHSYEATNEEVADMLDYIADNFEKYAATGEMR